jgi:hypothetical protein
MERVALVEVALDGVESPTARFLAGASVLVYKRGTETKATVHSAESGGVEVEQPLETDQAGRILSAKGEICWVDAGSYDLKIAGEVVPWEKGGDSGEGGGDVGSLVDVKGDLLVGAADDTLSRLGVGDDGNVLTVDSSQAAGVKWALPPGIPMNGCSLVLTSAKTIPHLTSTLVPWDGTGSGATYGVTTYNDGSWSSSNKERLTNIWGETIEAMVIGTLWYDTTGAKASTGERAIHVVLEGNNKKKFAGNNHALNATNGRIIMFAARFRLAKEQWVAIEAFQDSEENRKLEADGWGTGFQTARVTFCRVA